MNLQPQPIMAAQNEQTGIRTSWPVCSRCHAAPAAEFQRWCRKCASSYMREYRRRGMPAKFRRFVIQRAAELGIELPADFFDAPLGDRR